MEELNISVSNNLLKLIRDVKNIDKNKTMDWKWVDTISDYRQGLAQAEFAAYTRNVTIRVCHSLRENPELESVIVHELLHVRRNWSGFPRVRVIPRLPADHVARMARGTIENFIDHQVVFRETRGLGFSFDKYAENRVGSLRKIKDDKQIFAEHIAMAFDIAEVLSCFSPSQAVVQEIKRNLPFSFKTASRLMLIAQKYKLTLPYQVLLAYFDLIRYVDSNLKNDGSLSNALGSDLVLSNYELMSPASRFISIQICTTQSMRLPLLCFGPSDKLPKYHFAAFQAGTLGVEAFAQKLQEDICSMSMSDFLNNHQISFFSR